jgi:hypothetical protein
MTTKITITIDNETITPAECEALWLDWDAGRITKTMAAERGTTLCHLCHLIFTGKDIASGDYYDNN